MITRIKVQVDHQGLYDIGADVSACLAEVAESEGLCTLFIRHTSASLLVQENYDPSARVDLERWLNKLVPENDPDYTHTLEGPDDMPAHIKSALTATSLSIPFADGALLLGTWQGIFLWEHRHRPGAREIVIHITK